MEAKKVCPKCNAIQNADVAFCSSCGADLSNVPLQNAEDTTTTGKKFCPNCGQPVDPGSKFCAACGAVLIATENTTNTQQPHDSSYYYVPETTLKDKYCSYKGRLNRKPYILRGIAISVANAIIQFLTNSLGDGALAMLMSFLFGALGIVLGYASITLAIRRCHDKNHSGWWMFIPFYVIWLTFSKGTDGPNKYGPDPLPEERGL